MSSTGTYFSVTRSFSSFPAVLSATWRLHGSLPAHLRFGDSPSSSAFAEPCMRRGVETCGVGPQWLAEHRIATLAREELRRARVYAWVILPNAVHVVMSQDGPVSPLAREIKSRIERRANMLLRRCQPFWIAQPYERWVQSTQELQKLVWAVEQSPVQAGLVELPEEYLWSSAYEKSRAAARAARLSA